MSEPHPISVDELARLSVDAAGRLYWDGQEVVTTLSLPWWVNLAVLAGVGIAAIKLVYEIRHQHRQDERQHRQDEREGATLAAIRELLEDLAKRRRE